MKKIKVGEAVWKYGQKNGYEGPGLVVAIFQNWMGQDRFVVAHQIAQGKGWFYHIYSRRELTEPSLDGDDASHSPPPR